jgi:hypothetical protein
MPLLSGWPTWQAQVQKFFPEDVSRLRQKNHRVPNFGALLVCTSSGEASGLGKSDLDPASCCVAAGYCFCIFVLGKLEPFLEALESGIGQGMVFADVVSAENEPWRFAMAARVLSIIVWYPMACSEAPPLPRFFCFPAQGHFYFGR